MADAEFESKDIDLKALSFDSTMGLSFGFSDPNEDTYFVFGFKVDATDERFCYGFPTKGMGNNWDFPHFYDYVAASYDFYYYDNLRDPQYTDIYDEYFPEQDVGVFEKFKQYIIDLKQQQGLEVSSVNIYYGWTYDQLKWRAVNWLGCSDLPDSPENLTVFPLLNQQQKQQLLQQQQAAKSGNEVKKTKIRRTNVAHSKLGLTVALHPDKKNYRGITKNNYRGFRVLIHGPLEFPEVAARGFPIGKGEEVFAGIKPVYLESSEDVKSMPLKQRECLTQDEDLTQYSDMNYNVFAKC